LEVTIKVALEILPFGLVTVYLAVSRYPMPLHVAMQEKSRQARLQSCLEIF